MFIDEPAPSPERQALYEGDIKDLGYVMNLTRAWAWIPAVNDGLFDLLDRAAQIGELSYRDKGILITAMASRLGDSYCSLAWGTRLAEATDPETAASVISGQPSSSMTVRDVALASWARKLAASPNSTTQADVDDLRKAGMSHQQIAAATAYVALRVAFSTFNDAIGAAPDQETAESAPSKVVSAVTFGRPADPSPSTGR
ncbi:MAG: carboxymuconolactone decarboxylase family protein [Acidimicrobiia bacterium]